MWKEEDRKKAVREEGDPWPTSSMDTPGNRYICAINPKHDLTTAERILQLITEEATLERGGGAELWLGTNPHPLPPIRGTAGGQEKEGGTRYQAPSTGKTSTHYSWL